MPTFVDLYGGFVFDAASQTNAQNFLRYVGQASKPYSIYANATDRWIVEANFGGVGLGFTYVGFFPPANGSFVPGPTSQKTPPLGVVDAIVVYDSAGLAIAVFSGLAALGHHANHYMANPSLLVSGDDDLIGSGQADIFHSGAGNDVMDGGGGDDQLFGDAGNDFIHGNSGNDTLHGGEGDDWLEGFSGDDTLNGDAGADTLVSDGVGDQYNGGAGDDVLAIFGNTTFVDVDYSSSVFNGGDGEDLLGVERYVTFNGTLTSVEGFAFLTTSLATSVSVLRVNWDLIQSMPTDLLVRGRGGQYLDLISIQMSTPGVADISGWRFEDWGASNQLVELIGTDGADTITGSSGYDSLIGEGGDDLIVGGAGNDYLYGRIGNDSLDGGAGIDHLNGGVGDDLLNGGDGLDTADYSGLSGAVQVSLADSASQNTGAGGWDTLIGIENLSGTLFNDELRGDDEANWLEGGGGDDILIGAGGDDILTGFVLGTSAAPESDGDDYFDGEALPNAPSLEARVFDL